MQRVLRRAVEGQLPVAKSSVSSRATVRRVTGVEILILPEALLELVLLPYHFLFGDINIYHWNPYMFSFYFLRHPFFWDIKSRVLSKNNINKHIFKWRLESPPTFWELKAYLFQMLSYCCSAWNLSRFGACCVVLRSLAFDDRLWRRVWQDMQLPRQVPESQVHRRLLICLASQCVATWWVVEVSLKQLGQLGKGPCFFFGKTINGSKMDQTCLAWVF